MLKRAKKTMVWVAILVGLAMITGLTFTPAYAGNRLVVATWGGSWGDSLRKYVAEPFEKEYNCEVEFSIGVSGDQVAKVRAQKKNPQLDVVMVTSDSAAQLWEQKLIVPITPDKVPNMKNLYPVAIGKDNSYVAMYAYDIGIAWRTDKLNLNIENWEGLWKFDLQKRFGVPYPTWSGMRFLVTVAKVFGGSEYDIDPGFQKLIELKPQFGRMFKGDAEHHQMISSGEIWVTPIMSPDAMQLIDKGVPIKFVRPKDGVPALYDTLTVVKDCPNPDLAFKFVNMAIDTAGQKGHSEACFVIPMKKGVELIPKVAQKMPTVEELELLLNFDDGQINKMKDEWIERYNKEVLTF